MSEEDVTRFTAPIIIFIEFLLALVLAVYLLYQYGDIKRQNPFVTVCTLIIWFMSFVIIFLLPVDVSSVSTCLPLILQFSFLSPIWFIISQNLLRGDLCTLTNLVTHTYTYLYTGFL